LDANPAAVAVIVVTRNSASCLGVCLESVLASEHSPLQVIVVDNDSTDGTRALVAARFPTVELVALARNVGYAAAANVGLCRSAPGSAHGFLVNPDTRMAPSLVSDLVDVMRRHPDLGIVGPLQHEYRPAGPCCEGPPNAWSHYMLGRLGAHEFVDQVPDLPPYGSSRPDADGLADVAFVQGAALFLRLDVLARTGPLDETYFCYYEEVDLCRRTRWAGCRVCLATNLGIEHAGGGSTAIGSLRVRLMTRNRYYYALTDPRLDRRALSLLLHRFAMEDCGLRRPRRVTRLLALWQSCGWLLRHLPQVLARRAANEVVLRTGSIRARAAA
jgi:GT2 family glycosyltransferase